MVVHTIYTEIHSACFSWISPIMLKPTSTLWKGIGKRKVWEFKLISVRKQILFLKNVTYMLKPPVLLKPVDLHILLHKGEIAPYYECFTYYLSFILFSTGAVVIAFVVCWLPYHARRLMYCYVTEWTPWVSV